VNIVDYFLYKNGYKIFNPVAITIRRGLKYKGENRGDKSIWVIIILCFQPRGDPPSL
jgi:hypothetical protein